MIRFLTEILCLTLCFGVFFNGECRILKDWQNIVKSEEEEKKIEELDVNKGGCNISAGWNLTGRDLGCCGNYEGCCRIASKVCYLHDSICQCCRLGWIFCGPECKPETECLLTTEKRKNILTNHSSSSSSFSPSTNSSERSSSMIIETVTSNQEKEASSITSSSSVSKIENTSEEVKQSSFNSSSNATNPTDFNQMEPDLVNDPDVNAKSESENRREMPVFFNNTVSEKQRVTHTMGEVENENEFPLLKTYSRHNDIIEGSGEDA